MAMEKGNNGNYYQSLEDKILHTPTGMQLIGATFKGTTERLATAALDLISTDLRIPELDNIIFTPIMARNDVGVSDIMVNAYFTTGDASGNIYYRGGKGKKARIENGRLDMVSVAGVASGGTGPFGTSDYFRHVIQPLCKRNDKGNVAFNIKSTQFNGQAQIELDFNAVMCIILGIAPNDPVDFTIEDVRPIPNTENDFSVVVTKIATGGNGSRKGRNGKINYARISNDLFNRYNNNNGGKNNGRRSY